VIFVVPTPKKWFFLILSKSDVCEFNIQENLGIAKKSIEK